MKKYLYLIINALLVIGSAAIVILITEVVSATESYNFVTLVSVLGLLYLIQEIVFIGLILFNIIYWGIAGLMQKRKKKTLFLLLSIILLILNIALTFIPFFIFTADYTSLISTSLLTNVVWYFLNPLLIFAVFFFIILSTSVSKNTKIVKSIILFIAIFIVNTLMQGLMQVLAIPNSETILEMILNIKDTFNHILSTMVIGMTLKHAVLLLLASILVTPFGEKRKQSEQLVKTPTDKMMVDSKTTKECSHEIITFKNRRSLKMSARARNELYIEKAELKNKKLKKIKRLNKNKYGL